MGLGSAIKHNKHSIEAVYLLKKKKIMASFYICMLRKTRLE